jgi:hypothetical protein
MQFRGTTIQVSISGDEMTVSAAAGGFDRPVSVGVGGEVRKLGPGEQWEIALRPRVRSEAP